MRPKLRQHLARLFPHARVVSIDPMGPDSGATAATGATIKAAGYGQPVHIALDDRGQRRELVWRVAGSNAFGHDRRADRAAATLQAFEDFAHVPLHVAPIDVGAVRDDGELVSLRDAGELYLVTAFAPGTLYVDDLRRLAAGGHLRELDVQRLDVLAFYLADLHVAIPDGAVRYHRAIRDLIGHGEGIFGIVDGYPDGTPGASVARLRALEERCAAWRWRLRERSYRLARTHGDFHPFNLVFDHLALTTLDASRGGCGDPADDITALAINFVLFAIDSSGAAAGTWRGAFGPLWRRWWARCAELRFDRQLLDVAPPFFAWRALVVCNPVFYPSLSARGRDAILGLAERALEAGRLDVAMAEELFV